MTTEKLADWVESEMSDSLLTLTPRRDFAADEVAFALNVSPATASNLCQVAVELAALPGLLEAVSQGMLTQRHAMAVLRTFDRISLNQEVRLLDRAAPSLNDSERQRGGFPRAGRYTRWRLYIGRYLCLRH